MTIHLEVLKERLGASGDPVQEHLDGSGNEIVPAIPLFFEIRRESTSSRVERYSWDAANSYPALDRISLVPDSE